MGSRPCAEGRAATAESEEQMSKCSICARPNAIGWSGTSVALCSRHMIDLYRARSLGGGDTFTAKEVEFLVSAVRRNERRRQKARRDG
jgi:hypothetical protein